MSFSNTSEGVTANLTSISILTTIIKLSILFFIFWKGIEMLLWIFLFLMEQMEIQKIIYVVHSVHQKFTQIWQLPLLRTPEMCKGPFCVISFHVTDYLPFSLSLILISSNNLANTSGVRTLSLSFLFTPHTHTFSKFIHTNVVGRSQGDQTFWSRCH